MNYYSINNFIKKDGEYIKLFNINNILVYNIRMSYINNTTLDGDYLSINMKNGKSYKLYFNSDIVIAKEIIDLIIIDYVNNNNNNNNNNNMPNNNISYYLFDNFIKNDYIESNTVKILDSNNILKYIILLNSIVKIMINKNIIIIDTTSNSINLTFMTELDSKKSLLKLQNYIDSNI